MNNKKFFNAWYEWILFFGALIVLISGLFFSSGLFFPKWANPLANVLFAVFNLITTGFISYKISYFISKSGNIEQQKKLAKTSIRHLRNSLTSLNNLDIIIEEMINNVTEKLYKQNFGEIKNHIKNIMKSISSFEYDFRDLVGDEIEKEKRLFSEIEKYKEKLEQIQKSQEQKNKLTDKEMVDLRNEMKSINKNIEAKLNDVQGLGLSMTTSLPLLYNINGIPAIDINKIGGGIGDFLKKNDIKK